MGNIRICSIFWRGVILRYFINTHLRDLRMSPKNAIWLQYIPKRLRDRVQDRYLLQKIISNTFWLFADKAVRIVVGIFVGALIARYLGPSQQGELAFVIAYLAVFQIISELGMNNIAIRDMARLTNHSGQILISILRIRIIVSICCWFGAILGMLWWKSNEIDTVILTSIVGGSILFQSSDGIDLWFQSQNQNKRTVIAKNLAFLAASIIKLVLVFAKAPLWCFAYAITFEAIFSCGALIYAYKKYPTQRSSKNSSLKTKALLKEAIPFLISGIFLTLSFHFDKILISNLLDTNSLGLYAIGTVIVNSVMFLPVIIGSSLAPTISVKLTLSDDDKPIILLYSLLIWMGITVSIILYLLSDFIVLKLYGSSYTESISVMQIFSFSLIPIFLSVGNDYLALFRCKGHITFYRTIFAFAISVFLNLLLIPKIGLIGAAITALGAHTLSNTVLYWIVAHESFSLHLKALYLPIARSHLLIRTECKL
jgi:O-antigen/teichoic acid export membrane protein